MSSSPSSDRRPPAPNKRVQAKARTRGKILDAAKRLFAEKGYEAATIRDIAAAAGMSTGAVFASFTGKADVFGEIVLADRSASYEIMEAVLDEPQGKPEAGVADILGSMFEAGYRFRLSDLPLMQATISASWSPDMGADVRQRMARKPVTDLIARTLRAAIDRGELSADLDTELLSRMLCDCYLSNYAEAVYDGWPLEHLMVQMRAQIGILLASARTSRKT